MIRLKYCFIPLLVKTLNPVWESKSAFWSRSDLGSTPYNYDLNIEVSSSSDLHSQLTVCYLFVLSLVLVCQQYKNGLNNLHFHMMTTVWMLFLTIRSYQTIATNWLFANNSHSCRLFLSFFSIWVGPLFDLKSLSSLRSYDFSRLTIILKKTLNNWFHWPLHEVHPSNTILATSVAHSWYDYYLKTSILIFYRERVRVARRVSEVLRIRTCAQTLTQTI